MMIAPVSNIAEMNNELRALLLLLVWITTVALEVGSTALLLLSLKRLERENAISNSHLLAVLASISGIGSVPTASHATMSTSPTSVSANWSALRTDTTSQTHKGR